MKLVVFFLVNLVILAAVLWVFGPREPVEAPVAFDVDLLGSDIDAYLERVEADVPELRPGAEKQVIWADPGTKARTPISIVYVHGFSASLQEIRPVPDRVAEALGANLYFTRLAGHGRNGPAMLDGSVPAWLADVSEAMAIGRAIGDRVVVIGTSTGGTLATIAAFDPLMAERLAGLVLVSPNFAVNVRFASLLTMPWGRQLLPRILGPERQFEPRNAAQAEWWTTAYPTAALAPMAAAVAEAARMPYATATVPVLAVFSDADQVVRAERTREVLAAWGGPVTLAPLLMGPADDQFAHVVAGDIVSPGQTDRAVTAILDWIETLPSPPPSSPSG